uniref:Retroviral aspartyl protease n=1 Tax=Romanomermis culicivorax TaxID=13658 RepID=A0A915HQK3_ROMCU
MPPWEQHIHYNAAPASYITTPTDLSRASSQSSLVPFALPALPSTSPAPAGSLDVGFGTQPMSTVNMVIPSKEIASAAPIVSPGIICWNATTHTLHDPYHIRSSVCQIQNLMLSTKIFVRKYASTGAFQIPIKIGSVNAHALIDTAQCSMFSSSFIKPAFDKQLPQLPICGKIKVANGAIITTHSPVVVTMESIFGEHMIKCVILDDHSSDQCIINTDFLVHPDIPTILNFKDNYIEIQVVELLLKVIEAICLQMELFLNALHNNLLEEIPKVEKLLKHPSPSPQIASNG